MRKNPGVRYPFLAHLSPCLERLTLFSFSPFDDPVARHRFRARRRAPWFPFPVLGRLSRCLKRPTPPFFLSLPLSQISGKATSHGGHLQLQVGATWGRLSRAKGESLPRTPPEDGLSDLSSWRRLFGAVVLRRPPPGSDQPLQCFVPDDVAAQSESGADAEGGEPPFPVVEANYLDTERGAAMRAVTEHVGIPPGDFRLTPLPPLSRLHAMRPPRSPRSPPEATVTSAYVALCDRPTEMCDGGVWLDLPAALAQWPSEWGLVKEQLLAALATVAGFGLLTRPVVEASGLAAQQAAPAAPAAAASAVATATAVLPVPAALAVAPGAVKAPAVPAKAAAAPPGRLLPVTILSGFLGAGKTSIVQHVLHHAPPGLKVTCS